MKAVIQKLKFVKKFSILNSTLSMIIKNGDKIVKICKTIKFEPDRKCLRIADYENLEAALLVWFKKVRLQNVSVFSALLMEKANIFAGQMGLEFPVNPGCLEWFKKRKSIIFKNICGES
jgi:hypothetical protein